MGRVPPDPQALLAHADFVRALARTLVHDAARADDLAQETWVATLEHPPRTVESSRGWLLTVLRNLARRLSRAEIRRTRWESAAARPEPVPSSHDIVAREESRRRVVEAVLALEEPYRSAIVLRFYEDLPPRAIARRLAVPVETARTRIKRGLAQLRARLDGEWGGDRSAWCAALAPLLARKSGLPGALAGGIVAMKTGAKVSIAAALLLGLSIAFWPEGSVSPPQVARVLEVGAAPGPSSSADARLAVAPEVGIERDQANPPGAERRPLGEEGPRASGIVVDRGGRPVGGARVFSYPESLGRAVRLSPDPESDPVQRTETDTKGRFEVPLGGRSTYFSVLVEADGFSPKIATSLRPGGDVRLVLDPARAFVGTVADREGRTVAGARIRWLGLLASAQVERQTVSGPDGSYRIEGIPSPRATEGTGMGLAWSLDVEAAGFAPLRIGSPVSPETEGSARHDLVLIRGATLRGRVVEAESDSPIAGATVRLWGWDGTGSFSLGGRHIQSPWNPHLLAEGVSAADGTFGIEHLPAAGFHRRGTDVHGRRGPILGFVTARAAGYAEGSDEVLHVKDGEATDSTVRLWRSAKVRGRVVDGRGTPIPGVSVLAFCHERGRQASSLEIVGLGYPSDVTDAAGRFAISDIPASPSASRVTILARAKGSGSTSSQLGATLRAGEETEVADILLKTDPAIDLVVVDEQGRPVGGAMPSGPDPIDMAVTGEDGRLRVFFQLLEEGEKRDPRRLVVRAPGYRPVRTPDVVPSAENPPEVRVVLAPGHRVAGRVLLPDGAPARDVPLYVVNPAIPTGQIAAARVERGDRGDAAGLPGPRVYGSAISGEDGSFEARDLPEGPYTLVALWKRPRKKEDESEVRAVLTGVRTDAEDVVIRVPAGEEEDAAAATVEGTVRDAESGAPFLDFEVELSDGSRVVKGEKPAPGRFRVKAPAGTWTLRVTSEGFAPWERAGIAVTPGSPPDPIAVSLDRGVTVRGFVRGLPADGEFELGFRREGERDGPSTHLGKDRSYRLTGFRPGKHRVRLWGGPYLPSGHPVHLDVPEGEEEIRYDVDAVPAVSLHVRLRSARVSIGETAVRMEIRDSAGRVAYALHGRTNGRLYPTLLPGNYRIRVEAPGGQPREQEVAIEVGERPEVDVEIP
ncbi:MAG: sigma-70 family RNA polymerase sigma factor [Planctomycetes bacterium]|nr:sigma-70 family RNA polymerase sigma factor [Planctomycetota bacterium]